MSPLQCFNTCYSLYLDAPPKIRVLVGGAFWKWLDLECVNMDSGYMVTELVPFWISVVLVVVERVY